MKPECLTRADAQSPPAMSVFSQALRVAVLAALFVSPGALAQSSWVQQSPVTHPGPLLVPAMAYDALHQQVVLFSGTSSNGNAATTPNDTWLWNGSQGTWTLAAPAHKPAGRVSAGIAYDELHQQVVIFGGGVGNTTFGDTWVWDGNDWTQTSPANSPPARQGFSMAYDEIRQQIVLFGGLGSTGTLLNDTWTWDGANWTRQLPAISPAARLYHQMAFDSARQQVVLFGGESFTLGQFSDTWIWNGTNWVQQAPAVQPPALRFHAMVYDSALQQTVVFGGYDTLGPTAATWLWDGVNWSQFTGTTPSPRYDVGIAYDAGNQQAVIFGGDTGGSPPIVSETWTFGAVQPVVNVTVPAGVQFTFNGQTYTSSQSIGIGPGRYTLSTASQQALGTGVQALFTSWSDGGAQTHAVIVGASNVNITGAFTTQYLLTTSASPVNGGTVTQTGAVSNGPYYDAGSLVSVFQTPAAGYAFSGWSGACNGTGACFVTMNSPAAVTGNFAHPTYPVTINVPPGVQFSLGGFPLTGSTTIQLPAGDYGLSTASLQATGIGTQAVFLSWSDGGAQAHTLTVPSAAISVTGAFKTQYFLTANVSPANGGALSPASGFYDAGTPLSPVAGANAGFEFEYWSGGGCSGSNAFCFLVMNAPTVLTANFLAPFHWVPLFPVTSPDSYTGFAAGTPVYDEAHQQTVFFLNDSPTLTGETWVWDGVTWTKQLPAHNPPPRVNYGAAYDSGRNQVVVFGGVTNEGGYLADTWTWDGSDWTQQFPATSPSSRHDPSMVYDPVHGKILLFGGTGTAGSLLSDLWTWDNGNWTLHSPATGPSARELAAMTWDAARQEVVLYGGSGADGPLNDTWTWNGSAWNQKAPVTVPDGGFGSMVYDSLIQKIVLIPMFDIPLDEKTWLWDGSTWTSTTAPGHHPTGSMAYDEVRQQVLSFDTNQYTWVFTNLDYPQHLLTFSTMPMVGGSVTAFSLDQPGPSYYSGTPVNLLSTASAGYIFTGWSGDCSGTAPVCFVIMSADRNVTATFSNGPVNVTVNVPAGVQFTLNGTVYTGTQILPLPPGNYPLSIASPQSAGAGTQVVFSSWSDGGAQAHQITVAGPMSVTAAFRTQYALTTTASPIQGGIVFSTGGPWYDSGTNVTVIQIPTQGYTFANWSGACSGSGACSVTMNAPESVTANYNAPKFNLTISVPAGVQYSLFGFPLTGTQTLSLPPGNYPIAIASPQASGAGTQLVFVSWSDGGAATHTVSLGAAALTVTGTFKTQYLLTTTATPAAEGSVAGAGYYDAGAAVPVVAIAAQGYALQYWSGGCSGSANCFLFMNGPLSVTATFGTPQAWVQLFPASNPDADNSVMVYDSARQQIMSFFGESATDFDADGGAETWIFDGANWIQKNPAHTPIGRGSPGMAFDRANAQAVLFGGEHFTALSETWVWDGNDWTQKFPSHHPAGRVWQAMAYDAARAQTVLFGGFDTDQQIIYGDTWVWDGNDWLQKAPAHVPPARSGAAIAYDAFRQTVVMFGGSGSDGQGLNDTWLWTGADWTQQLPATAPPSRSFSVMADDPVHRQMLLFGGAARDDTWIWDGTNWLQQTPPVSPPMSIGTVMMAYDELHRQAVLFLPEVEAGDQDALQTWVWEPPSVNLVPQAPTAVNDGKGNYLVTVTLKNQGNVPLADLFLSSARLGNVAAAGFSSAFVAAIEPGATGSFTAKFPIASIAGKTASVTFQGTYSAGSVVAAPWTANARQIVLP